MIGFSLLNFWPFNRARKRRETAAVVVGRINAYVMRAATAAREEFFVQHQEYPQRGDLRAAEHANQAWAILLRLMAARGFDPFREIPPKMLEDLHWRFLSIFISEAPLPTEV